VHLLIDQDGTIFHSFAAKAENLEQPRDLDFFSCGEGFRNLMVANPW